LLVNKWQGFLLDPNKSWLPLKTTRMTDFAENQPVAWKSLWLFDTPHPNNSSLLKNYIKRGRSNLVTSCENRFGLARLLLATLGLLISVPLNLPS
jgi:hypothetical protein